LGHQALGQYYGAELKLAIKPMHGKVSAIQHDGKGIYKDIVQPLDVCRYHSLIIDTRPVDDLIITATTEEGECMSFVHKRDQVTGIQYHPEAILTAYGIELLGNWLKSI
jgi:anthranilate synthase/aminodeoxychorismate synthase-like glutamine amidotransferase